jgi:uncharacterized protein YbjQ (UPF0145 family)
MHKTKIITIIALIFVSGCSVPATVTKLEATSYPSKPDDFNVKVLESSNIERSFRVIALVEREITMAVGKSENQSRQIAVEKLKKATRKLGGDALIDLSTNDENASEISNYGSKITGKVIVWTVKDKN